MKLRPSREELLELARHADIKDRETMTLDELAVALADANADLEPMSASRVEPITGVVEAD